ncbi:recombinase family protein [Pseudomonas sp. DY-1]|uniref:recombinase family protein n=1 Tax=Pseudomonas sp. DY-1 TaxID=1755504 RepID=UPI000EA9A7F0|nr:recombinase family protein [Pseudomonas sp. DY-1]AYF87516.1 recombinase family protein [Pseudomonas sp. DY-1]
MNVVAYYRVSTRGQGESGLGLEAQRQYIEQAAKANGWTVVAEYVEVVSGGVPPLQRPEWSRAVAHNLTVIAAKLDRISRDVEHIASLMKRVQFKVATMPHADSFQLHLFAALAEQERQFIRARTKEALAALQERADSGDVESQQKIERRNTAGSKTLSGATRAKARESVAGRVAGFHSDVQHHIEACLFRGVSTFAAVAECLNSKGVNASRGGQWNATQVRRVMTRLQLSL